LIGNYMIPLLIVSVLIVLAVYPPVLALVKGLQKNDVEIVKSATKDVPVIGNFVAYLLEYSERFMR